MKNLLFAIVFAALSAQPESAPASEFVADIPPSIDREWAGPAFWANPLPDWRVSGGRFVCDQPGGNRNIVVLTQEMVPAQKPFRVRIKLDQLVQELQPHGGWVGLQIGLRGDLPDYRNAAVFGRGLCLGLSFGGRLFIGKPDQQSGVVTMPPFKGLTLEVQGIPDDGTYQLVLSVFDPGMRELGRVQKSGVHPSWMEGLVAIAMSTTQPPDLHLTEPRPTFRDLPTPNTARGGLAGFAFSNLRLFGGKFEAHPERAFGPILWCQHSLQNDGNLKLMAQFPPLGQGNFEATLELDGRKVATAGIDPVSRTALFRVEEVNTGRAHKYRVLFSAPGLPTDRFNGQILAIPNAGKLFTMAAFSCNGAVGFPHNDLVKRVKSHKPDFLSFLGDQIYEWNGGYGVLYDGGARSVLDYLHKYYLHGWAWRDLLRNLPSVTIPDDHDVFHGNLWGCGGRAADNSNGFGAPSQDSGGYKMPPEFVNAVHRSQAGSLPDPVDPAPCDQGITTYFTRWLYGPLDIAILADRQWKSAPKPLLPGADILNGFVRNEAWNPKTQSRHPDAQLLGPRQEQFLDSWAVAGPGSSRFRIVLSQTPWICLGTLPEGQHRSDSVVPTLPILDRNEYATNDVATTDFDSDGWPSEKRNLALRSLKKAGVCLHIAGDQHLGSAGRYGIEEWNDGPFWLATPAIANLWPRRWMPKEKGRNPVPAAPRYTGEYEDQFGNKLTLLAAANPARTYQNSQIQISDRAAGYSIIKFAPGTRDVTVENWPYWASPSDAAPNNRPYAGWPITFKAP